MQAAFRHAVAQFNRMNESANGRRYELQAFVDIISTADTVKLSRLSKIDYLFFPLIIYQLVMILVEPHDKILTSQDCRCLKKIDRRHFA